MSNIAPTGALWCIIRENRSIFKITIGADNDLIDLRNVIKNVKPNYFANVDADELILWRTNVASNILRNKETAIEPYLNEKLEDPADTVGNTFQNVVGNNIRVIVGVPVTEQPGASEKLKEKDFEIFVLRTDNTRKSSSVYKYVRESGGVSTWKIETEIYRNYDDGIRILNQYPNAPTQGSDEIRVNQPFCRNVVNEIVNMLSLERELLVLGGDHGFRQEGQVYADIIIGHRVYRQELTNSPPDLSKGLGWEVKNDLSDGTKEREGKGQLIKYARIYLTADRPLTRVFYGCLTDGSLWKFTKIQLLYDDDGAPKMKFEESPFYQWNEQTASLITGLISRYYAELTEKLREKKESQDNDNTYMYRNKSSISSESLLASFIKEGVNIRLNSGNYIHVQITSHLGTGRECIVFLAQVCDYGIKDAVLKIEVCKNTEISQVYREISVLCALRDLSCVPKILFEGHTAGGFPALLTDFVGQSLESLIPNNGNIDDFILFRVIPDLLSCLQEIHASGYAHGDVAIRNVIQRNGHFYLIDFGLATLLQLLSDPCQAIIQDYVGLCQIIGIIKFGEKMSFSELIGKLKGELKSLVVFVENASRWKITDEGKWLEKFGAIVKQFYERSSRKVLLEITENINNS